MCSSILVDQCHIYVDWVHGYRAIDMRNNLFYNTNNSIIYPAATVAVILSQDKSTSASSNKQSFYGQHTKGIYSIAIHPNKVIIATGDIINNSLLAGETNSNNMSKPVINVWDSITQQSIVSLSNFHKRGISHLCFSPDDNGALLLSLGLDDHHSLAVYNWRERQLVFNAHTNVKKVLSAVWMTAGAFVISGVDFISFWSKQGRGFVGK